MPEIREPEGELDLHRLFGVLWRRRYYVIGTILVVLLITGSFTFLQSPLYKTCVDIMITTATPPLQVLGLPIELAQLVTSKRGDLTTHIEIIQSQPVLERLRSRLGADSEYMSTLVASRRSTAYASQSLTPPDAKDLREAISVRQISPDILRIEATACSPIQAAKIANYLAEAYQEADRERARQSLQAVLKFLDQKIEETRAQLNLSAEALAEYARKIGMVWETQAVVAKISRFEQLLAEASVELEDTRAQLETVERFLAGVKEDLFERFIGPEGAELLIELHDKLTLIRNIQREIAQLEQDRAAALQAGDYIKAQDLQSQIIKKREDLETTASQRFIILEKLPQYEELIKQQLKLKLKVIALENRVAVLERMKQDEVRQMIDNSLELARLQRELDVSEELYTLILTQNARTRVAEIAETGSVVIVNPAQLPEAPFRPNRTLNLLVGMFLGILGGIGAAFLRETLDTTFRSTKEIEEILGIPVVGTIPKIVLSKDEAELGLLLPKLEFDSIEHEAFSSLVTNLRFIFLDKPLRSLLTTSPGPGVGKSVVAVNLALKCSCGGKRVLLVEADLRRPVLAKRLGLEDNDRPGLSELTLGAATLAEVVREVRFEGFEPFYFISAGRKPPSPVDFFSSQAFAQTLAKLVDTYDLVIIDSLPVNMVADPLVISQYVSGVLLVLDAEKTTKKEAEAARQALARANALLVGTILNKVSLSSSEHYYRYHYKHYYTSKKTRRRKG